MVQEVHKKYTSDMTRDNLKKFDFWLNKIINEKKHVKEVTGFTEKDLAHQLLEKLRTLEGKSFDIETFNKEFLEFLSKLFEEEEKKIYEKEKFDKEDQVKLKHYREKQAEIIQIALDYYHKKQNVY